MGGWYWRWLQVLAMQKCGTSEYTEKTACSGSCKSTRCSNNAVWVLASCKGMAAVFEKKPDGTLNPVLHNSKFAAPLVGNLSTRLAIATENAEFRQLILVGGANDISWTQLALSPTVQKNVVAEIEYPLIIDWFKGKGAAKQLKNALENVFSG